MLLLNVLTLATSIALPHAVVAWDVSRLSPACRQRMWNSATHWSAIVAFGWLAVVVHFGRTRRSLGGAGLGVVWAGSGLVTQMALLSAIAELVA